MNELMRREGGRKAATEYNLEMRHYLTQKAYEVRKLASSKVFCEIFE